MKKEYKEKFPKWCNDTKTWYSTCLTNDLDSLFSCIILEKIKGYPIEYFYDFNSLWESEYSFMGKCIGVDLDIIFNQCEAWGNHTTILYDDVYNANCANLNIIDKIGRDNYYEKYAGSTLLTIMSYYDWDISKYSEEAKMVLLCIDSTYLGYYSNWEIFKNRNKYYLVDVLEFEELYKLQQKYKRKDFELLQAKYKLKSKIEMQEGRLSTGIDLEGLSKLFNLPFVLPEDNFKQIKRFKDIAISLNKTKEYPSKDTLKANVFTMALTNKNFLKLSIF